MASPWLLELLVSKTSRLSRTLRFTIFIGLVQWNQQFQVTHFTIAHFTCLNSTQVQILTPEELRARRFSPAGTLCSARPNTPSASGALIGLTRALIEP